MNIENNSHLNTEYKLIDKSSQLTSALEPFYQASIIALDCETTGLDPYTAQVRLVQLAIADHPVVIIDLKAIAPSSRKPLRSLLSSNIRKVGHNLKFDLMHLKVAGLPVSGPFGDTYLQWKLLTAGLSSDASLEAITARLLHVKMDKSQQTSNWSTPVLSSAQLKYAATDAAVILPLYDLLNAKIKKASLAKTMSIEEAFLPALAKMSLNGIYLDTQQWVWSKVVAAGSPPNPPLQKGGLPEAPLFKGGLGGSDDWEGHPNDQRVLTTPPNNGKI